MLALIASLLIQVNAQSFFPVGKTGAATNYADRAACQAAEGQPCWDVADCPADECAPVMVDDLTRPRFLKRNVQACVASDCKADLAALVCTEGTAIAAADLVTVYCAVPNGYDQTAGDTLVRDPVRAKAKADAAALAAVRRAKVQEGLRKQDVGARIIALIQQNNQDKNLTNEQAVALTQALAPIIGQLQTGSIPSAKNLVLGLKPSGVITQADIDLALSQFADEGF